jgi:hypothetical protein
MLARAPRAWAYQPGAHTQGPFQFLQNIRGLGGPPVGLRMAAVVLVHRLGGWRPAVLPSYETLAFRKPSRRLVDTTTP